MPGAASHMLAGADSAPGPRPGRYGVPFTGRATMAGWDKTAEQIAGLAEWQNGLTFLAVAGAAYLLWRWLWS
jgi:hypothetical protein